jgi:hypothetical protein
MSKKLIEIPELHNNDYDFFDVLKGLCKVKVAEAQLQKVENTGNEKQENQDNNSNQLITSQNE